MTLRQTGTCDIQGLLLGLKICGTFVYYLLNGSKGTLAKCLKYTFKHEQLCFGIIVLVLGVSSSHKVAISKVSSSIEALIFGFH